MGRITRSLSSVNGTSSTRHAVHQQHKQQDRGSKHSKAVIGGTAAAGGVLLVILLFLTLFVYRRVKKSSLRTTPASDQQVRLRRFKYRELRSATGKFGEANKLGQGGFGSVYKGTLKNGQEVAVKKLDTASLQGEREFMNELSIVGSISGNSGSHVVGLIGFCADSKRKMLVYEYMSNRSLQEALFDEKHSLQLDWDKRTKIILDVARALAFLHGKCEPPIVHGDVKPSNVLLDSQFSAKLADFGLARIKTEVQDLRSEDVQEQERARSQRMARDRERKRKKRIEDHARVHQGQEPKDEEQQNQHVVQVDQPLEVSKKAEGSPKNADKATSGEETEAEQRLAEKRLSPASGDESHESPVLSSPTSRRAEEHKISRAEEHKISRAAGTPSSIAGADDDDEWSKMSQSAYGTEPDTWSKVSPSEMDCRSEISIDSSAQRSTMKFLGRKRWKKSASPSKTRDWWWKQDSGVHAGGGIKEYIVDWVSCERGRSRTREWPWNSSNAPGKDGGGKKKKKQARSGSLEWWAECDDNDDDELARRIKSEQKRKKKLQKQQEKLAMSVSRDDSREWWRGQGGGSGNTPVPVSGELFDDLSGEITKNDENEKMKRSMSEESFTFYHSGEIPASNTNNASLNNSMELLANLNNSDAANGRRRVRTRSREWWSGEMQRGKEWWSGELSSKRMRNNNLPQGGKIFETWSRESLSGELSRKPRHHRERSRSRSRDWWSGDLLSRATTVSSTPSMRGTVCYVAPEYGGGGMLTEKSDVYSFGVLILVVVSGRRPLQVVASPLSEFERANLISWARHAAQAGRALDLVDAKLGGVYSKQQANLFISVALLCLQRLPALRPSMSEVVKILSGEAELPALPFEFSPSPPGFKSRRKPSSEQIALDHPLLTS